MKMILTSELKYQKITAIIISVLFSGFFAQNVKAQDIKIYEAQSENYATLLDKDNSLSDWFELINTSEHRVPLKGYGLSDDLSFDSAWIFPDVYLDPGQIQLIYASGIGIDSGIDFWNILVMEGDTLKYKVPENEIEGWKSIGFDDSSWEEGPSGFGYGDGDDATVLNNITSVFIRAEFEIENLESIKDVLFHIDYDDGFRAYLNGVEIAYSLNMGFKDEFSPFNQLTEYEHEAVMYSGGEPDAYAVSDFKDLLVKGKNVLAVQVHNLKSSSSDFTAIPFLSVLIDHQPEDFRKAWFLSDPDNFHVSFKLDADTDSIFLFSPQGEIVDQLIFQSPGEDMSVGYPGNNFDNRIIFATPTPGEINPEEGVLVTQLDTVKFDTEPGLYAGEVTVSLSVKNASQTIYYTLNGNEPSHNSRKYQEPFTLTSPTTVKARVIQEGFVPGVVSTSSYYPFYDKTLPVAFISTKPYYLWDENYGIYVRGLNYEEEAPFYGANFWMDWERPAHVEMYFPGMKEKFNINAGIKLHGNWSRAHPQKSVSVFARKKYGDKSIKAKLFEDRDMDKFEAIIYRNSGNDWFGGSWSSGTYYRDLLISKLAETRGVDAMAGRPTIVYLNGEYWGIQNLREKVNEHYIAGNHHEDSEKLDILEKNQGVVEGDTIHYSQLTNFLKSSDITHPDVYEEVKKKMDIEEFIAYNVVEIYSFNGDWPGNNIKFWRPKRPNGKWRWIMFDTDFGFAIWDNQKVYDETMYLATATDGPGWPNPPWSTFLLRTLLKNYEFRAQFINTFADLMNTTLSTENVNAMIDQRVGEIDSEINFHSNKWGWTYSGWMGNNENMKLFSELRPTVMWDHLVSFFELSGLSKLSLKIQGASDGKIKLNSIYPSEFPWDGQYFDNVPVQLTAIPPEGYRFDHWDGDIYSTDLHVVVNMDSDKEIRAVFEAYQPTETEGIIINEISYKALKSEDSEDWVELYNNSSQYIDISGWILQDSDVEHRYKIPKNTVMPPDSYLVLCRDMYEFSEVHTSVYNVIGPFDFGFSGAGECISLLNEKEELRDQVCYANEYPWPEEANGQGYTLSLPDPDKDNMLGYNWNNSPVAGGTPGRPNNGLNPVADKPALAGTTLLDCYPNPFASTLNIPIAINKEGNICLEVFNMNGQKVKTLFEGLAVPGIQTFKWDGAANREGLYLVRLQTSEGIQVKKIILSK